MTVAYVEANLKHSDLLKQIHYDPGTGVFTQLVDTRGRKAGPVGGQVGPYWVISFFGRKGAGVLAHRLAWFYVHGVWPRPGLDHKDTDKLNNRIDNLRLATHIENACNRGLPKRNTLGYRGIKRQRDKWTAKITFNKVTRYLGVFDTPELASMAYEEAAKALHGEFYKEVTA